MNLRDRVRRLEARPRRGDAPPWQEVVAAIGRDAERARARLTGSPVDQEEAKRDGELRERWRRSQEICPDVIAQYADEARAKLLEARE